MASPILTEQPLPYIRLLRMSPERPYGDGANQYPYHTLDPDGAGTTSFTPDPIVEHLATIPLGDIASYEMVKRLNSVSQWRATVSFNPDNVTDDLGIIFAALRHRGVFAQTFIGYPSTSTDITRLFRKSDLFNFHTSTSLDPSDLPVWGQRGMMGAVMSTDLEHDGLSARLILNGTCALQWLADTVHYEYEVEVGADATAAEVQTQINNLLSANVTYERTEESGSLRDPRIDAGAGSPGLTTPDPSIYHHNTPPKSANISSMC